MHHGNVEIVKGTIPTFPQCPQRKKKRGTLGFLISCLKGESSENSHVFQKDHNPGIDHCRVRKNRAPGSEEDDRNSSSFPQEQTPLRCMRQKGKAVARSKGENQEMAASGNLGTSGCFGQPDISRFVQAMRRSDDVGPLGPGWICFYPSFRG